MSRLMNIAIVTPSFNRRRYILKFLRKLSQQTFTSWTLVVVHDGPSDIYNSVFNKEAADNKIIYAETNKRTANWGSSQRVLALKIILGLNDKFDYVVFWDDDNEFFKDALKAIAFSLRKNEFPDLLLVPFLKGSEVFPRVRNDLSKLTFGDVDSANLVVRPELANQVLNTLLPNLNGRRGWDNIFFFHILNNKNNSVKIASDITPIGCYDGLRFIKSLRYNMAIRDLGVRKLFRLLKIPTSFLDRIQRL